MQPPTPVANYRKSNFARAKQRSGSYEEAEGGAAGGGAKGKKNGGKNSKEKNK